MRGERQRVPQAIVPYAVGPLSMSVCAPVVASREEVERVANGRHPTGISSQWAISRELTFRTGEPNPCPCNNEPEERQHWLLAC